jgi:plasmid stabilization system protein ParE
VSRIHWTPLAGEDLTSIHQYISRDSTAAAQTVVLRLFAAIEQLADFPQSGRVVPEFGRPELRELVRGSYRIVYRVRDGGVQLIRIHHAARPLDPDAVAGAG